MHTKRAKFIYDVWDDWCEKHELTTFSEREGTRLINYTISRLVEEMRDEKAKNEPTGLTEEFPEGHQVER